MRRKERAATEKKRLKVVPIAFGGSTPEPTQEAIQLPDQIIGVNITAAPTAVSRKDAPDLDNDNEADDTTGTLLDAEVDTDGDGENETPAEAATPIPGAGQPAFTELPAATPATGGSAEERAEEKAAEEEIDANLARIAKRINDKGAATFTALATELRELIENGGTREIIHKDYRLQAHLLIVLMIDITLDTENRYDMVGPFTGTAEEIEAAYKAGQELYEEALAKSPQLFADPKKLIELESQAQVEAEEDNPQDNASNWMADDDDVVVKGKWFSNDDEDAAQANALETRNDPRRFGPSLQRRLDAFTQARNPWQNDEAALALQKVFKETLPFIDYTKDVSEAITTLLAALSEESNRELVGKHPHLRRHLLFLPRFNNSRPRGVLYRHVPKLTEETREKYLKLLEVIKENPRETGQRKLDKATQELIIAHLGYQEERVAEAGGAEAAPAKETVSVDSNLAERQDPLGGKKPLVILPNEGDDQLYITLEASREGMHGNDATAFRTALKEIDRAISGRMYGIKDKIHQSMPLKALLADLLLIPLQKQVIAGFEKQPYEQSLITDARALRAGKDLFDKVIKNWRKLFKQPKGNDGEPHDDFDRWLVDVQRRQNALSSPLSRDDADRLEQVVGFVQQLRSPEGVEAAATGLSAWLAKNDNRTFVGKNTWLRTFFFGTSGVVMVPEQVPPLTRKAKEHLLQVIELVQDNPRDTGLRDLPRVQRTAVEKDLAALREAVEGKRGTDRRFDNENLQAVDDVVSKLGGILYTSWPPNPKESEQILVAKKKTLTKNRSTVVKLLEQLENMLEKESFRNAIASTPELREQMAHIILLTQEEVVRQRSSGPALAAQMKNELSAGNREQLSEQLVKLVMLLKEYHRDINLQDQLKRLLTPQLYMLYSMRKPLTDTARDMQEDIKLQFRKLLDAVKEVQKIDMNKEDDEKEPAGRAEAIEKYADAVRELYNLSLSKRSKRRTLSEFPQVRMTFFSDSEGFLAWNNVPEGLSVEQEKETRQILEAIRKNPRDLKYNERPRMKRRITKQLDKLEKDLNKREVPAALSSAGRSLVKALDKYVPMLKDVSDERTFGMACAKLRRVLKAALEKDEELFTHYPALRERLYSYDDGFMVLKDVPENLSEISKAAATALLDDLLDHVGDNADFTKADLERMKRDIEDNQKADIARREAAERAEEEAKRRREEAEEAAENAADEAQEREDRSLSLSSGSGKGRSRDDSSTGGGYSGGASNPGVFDFESAKKAARRMPWFKPSSPPDGAPQPDDEMKKSDWAMSVYNYAWRNNYRYYYGGEIATYIQGLDEAINTSKVKNLLSMVGLGGRKNIRDHDRLAKALIFFLIKEPETLPVIPDPKDQEIVADFYTDILENDRLFETRRTDDSLELKQRLKGILENIKDTNREQMLEGLPASIKLPPRYNPRLVNAIADAKFNRSLQRTSKNAMAQSAAYGGMMPGMNPAFMGQGTMHPMRPNGRRLPHMGTGMMHHPMAGAMMMPGGMMPGMPMPGFAPGRGYPPYGHAPMVTPQAQQPKQPIVINVQAPTARSGPPPSPLMRAAQGRVRQVQAANAFQQAGQRRQANRRFGPPPPGRAPQRFGPAPGPRRVGFGPQQVRRPGGSPPQGFRPPPGRQGPPPQQEKKPSLWDRMRGRGGKD
ncbi:MAG: hypothetical protein PVJ92_01365 [Candidatus Dependentiae bacterium]|jgi:hypothetical protein